jgi:hypothetical protein
MRSRLCRSGLISLSLVCACTLDGSPGSEAEETSAGEGDPGDGDGDPDYGDAEPGDGDEGDGDGDGDQGDGDSDGPGDGDDSGDGDGDGDTDGGIDGDGDGDSDGDGDGDDSDVWIEMKNVQIGANFMPVVPPDPWSVSFTLTVHNDSGQPVTLNHFASSIIFNPSPNDNDGPDEFESDYEVDLTSIDAPVGQSAYVLSKTVMESVPDSTFCAWPVQLDNIMFELEGTEQMLIAGSSPTNANCVF